MVSATEAGRHRSSIHQRPAGPGFGISFRIKRLVMTTLALNLTVSYLARAGYDGQLRYAMPTAFPWAGVRLPNTGAVAIAYVGMRRLSEMQHIDIY